MKTVKFFAIFFVIFSQAFCQSAVVLKNLDIKNQNVFGQDKTLEIIAAVEEWSSVYKLERKVVVKLLTLEIDKKFAKKLTAKDEISLELAFPGVIYLGLKGDVRSIILHSLTHAIAPDSPTILAKPVKFQDGCIVGFQGLFILVKLKSGERTKFTVFEEGMAERNASIFTRYTIENEAYFKVGNLTRRHFFDDKFAVDLVKHNDVIGFVAVYLGKERSTIKIADILSVMSDYNRIWN